MTDPALAAIDAAIAREQRYLGACDKAQSCLMAAQALCKDELLTLLIERLAELVRCHETGVKTLGSERSKVEQDSTKTIAAYDAMQAKLKGKGASHAK